MESILIADGYLSVKQPSSDYVQLECQLPHQLNFDNQLLIC